MSEATSAVVPEVEPAKIVDNTNDHTPEPVTPPVVEKVPDPPTPQGDGMDELRTIVTQLGNTVATLTELVTQALPKDATPHSVPWTHKGSHRKDDD